MSTASNGLDSGTGTGTGMRWIAQLRLESRVRVRAEWHLDFFDRVHDERVAEVLDRALKPVAERLHAESSGNGNQNQNDTCTSILYCKYS